MIKTKSVFRTVIVICCMYSVTIFAAGAQEIVLPKGHVVDVLLLTQKENINDLQNIYFKDFYPPAKALGYQPVTGFRISQKPISGYFSPDALAIGLWPGDWQKRKMHFKQLSDDKPDIRSRRLDIWSTFNMLNFETKEDIEIAFNPQKTYVFSAYWLTEKSAHDKFEETMLTAIDKFGGKVEFFSDQAMTMFGYTDAPALTLLTKWENKQAFAQFNKDNNPDLNAAINRASEFFLDIKTKK